MNQGCLSATQIWTAWGFVSIFCTCLFLLSPATSPISSMCPKTWVFSHRLKSLSVFGGVRRGRGDKRRTSGGAMSVGAWVCVPLSCDFAFWIAGVGRWVWGVALKRETDNTFGDITTASRLQASWYLRPDHLGISHDAQASSKRRKFSQSKQRTKSGREPEVSQEAVVSAASCETPRQASMEQWTVICALHSPRLSGKVLCTERLRTPKFSYSRVVFVVYPGFSVARVRAEGQGHKP